MLQRIKGFIQRHLTNIKYRLYWAIASLPFIRRIDPDKVFAASFNGMKYGDNPAYIIEALKKLRPQIRVIWVRRANVNFKVPEYVETVEKYSFMFFWHMKTARVLIYSHGWENLFSKRPGQFLLNTWHGGLGIKKIAYDNEHRRSAAEIKRVREEVAPSDLVISNSAHLSRIYRSAFFYQGPIWECGYPKTDLLFADRKNARETLRNDLRLSPDEKLLIYVPTYRSYLKTEKFLETHRWPYDLDFNCVKKAMEKRFGGKWTILTRKHPVMNDFYNASYNVPTIGKGESIDVTSVPDIQLLLMGCDACISDFSSVIFDAALLKLPCFTYANDENWYAKAQGMYYHLEELPFPSAQTNQEMEEKILQFDESAYWDCLNDFLENRVGLHETGHATSKIAGFVNDIMAGKEVELCDISMLFQPTHQ